MLNPTTTLHCQGRLLDLRRPQIMGILNVTPDSFYDGGYYEAESAILAQTEAMLEAGAAIIDVGGMSSRPGAELIEPEEELERVLPAIEAIAKRFPEAVLSVDTIRARVARESVLAGASMVNDISAGKFDEAMFSTVAELQVPYVLMHMQGTPASMQQAPQYEEVVEEVLDFFIQKVGELRALGVKDIVLDPGFGFGKTVPHNFRLLGNMHVFQILDLPILAGVSRKSMICKVLKVNPPDALNGTTALHMIALQQGARILRVHDVREARETIQLFETLEQYRSKEAAEMS